MSTVGFLACRARRGVAGRGAFGHLAPLPRLRRIMSRIAVWRDRARQRRQLRSLNNHMLRDLGLTRADVLAESDKPFWRA